MTDGKPTRDALARLCTTWNAEAGGYNYDLCPPVFDAVRAALSWCDRKQAETEQWAEKHNPECECEVAQTTLELLAEFRKVLNDRLAVSL